MGRWKGEPKANGAVPVDTEEPIAVFQAWPGKGQGGCLILRGLGGRRRKKTGIRGTLCTRDGHTLLFGLCF